MQLYVWAVTEKVTVSWLRETAGHHPLFPWTLDLGRDQTEGPHPPQSGNRTLPLTVPRWYWERIRPGVSIQNPSSGGQKGWDSSLRRAFCRLRWAPGTADAENVCENNVIISFLL